MVICPGCGEENPAKFRLCGYCGVSLTVVAKPTLPTQEVRKTVTLLFSDLKGSTALAERLDPEAMREVMARYFQAMTSEIARHHGKVEKYIGDAIMAVFGLPRAHEDDALRAVRAAAGMRSALALVNAELEQRYGVRLANRTGVNTGEVVATDDPSANQNLVVGDAVNVAARLEQAAPENSIYLSESTYRLVRDAVVVEHVEPLELKGKSERIPAYQLVSAQGLDGYARRSDTAFVGRDSELAELRSAYRETCDRRTIRLITVIGDAGQGKSRLVREVVEKIAVDARVLRGRCLPYGDGITFWPLVGMAWEAAHILPDDAPEVARSKLLDAVGATDVAARLASAIGLSQDVFPLQELYWAARKFLEGLAAQGPVVAVVDDIHWAEPAFLDLLKHVLEASTNAPILVLATARPDLLEEHADWGESAASTRMVLRPLSDSATEAVVTNLLGSAGLPPSVISKIVGAAEGNPLYVEQLLSMLIDNRALRLEDGRWVHTSAIEDMSVPPTIHALLESRLDNLAREDRAAVEPAAVIGLEFERLAIESLVPDSVRPAIDNHLSTLTRKHFIRPARVSATESVYRFHHHLVRDTVYSGLLKRTRAKLHIAFVRWADLLNADRDRATEFQEILGYHLEQAFQYLRELGPLDAEGEAIGVDAATRLAAAGRRAFARSDMHAASNLLRRASALLAQHHPQRLPLLPMLGESLMELGDFGKAREVLHEAVTTAQQAGDERLELSAKLVDMFVRLYSGEPGEWGAEALSLAERAIPRLECSDSHDELATAWRLIGFVHGVGGRYAQANEAGARYMTHARSAGNSRLVARSAMGLAIGVMLGPTPVATAIAECENAISGGLVNRQVQSVIMCVIAQLRAMNGDFDEARRLYRAGRAMLRELGQGVVAAATGIDLGRVELMAGDLAVAEREVRADCDFLILKGETYLLSTMAALLARIVRDAGRDQEALDLCKTAEEAAAEDDVEAQAQWRSVRAPILARAGELADAEALARAAVDFAARSEAPLLRAETLCELASVLQMAGRLPEALEAIDQALELYEIKADVVSLARVRSWRASLPAT